LAVPILKRWLVPVLIVLLLSVPGFCEQPPVIRIGGTLSFSGRFQEPAMMMRDAYHLWAQQVNERGGLLGRPVRLVIRDDQSDPETARRHYRELIHDEQVELVFSPYGTPLTLAASEVTEAAGLVMLASAASGRVLWDRGHRFLFGMYALADRYFIGMLDLMARQGLDTVSIIYEDSPFHRDVFAGVQHWAKRFGIAPVFMQSFPPGGEGHAQLVEDMLRERADGLILSVYPTDGYLLLDLLQRTSRRPAVLGMTIAPLHPTFYETAGSSAEGIFGPSQWEPDERIPFPGTMSFIRAFEQSFGQLPSYHAGAAFAACQILERTIVEVGALDHELIRERVSALDTVTVIGRFKVDHLGRQVGHNPILVQWQEGKKEIVYPVKMQTSAPRFEPPRESGP
jgi:branched-chain amino acid transport system substrate-binding protein